MATKNDLIAVMAKEPTLNDAWFTTGVLGFRNLNKEKVEENRQRLLGRIEGFIKTCDWLTQVEKTKGIRRTTPSSYGLKHIAEKDIGYISNGVFIAAAIHCGFKYTREANPHFNMSPESIAAILERQKREGKRK